MLGSLRRLTAVSVSALSVAMVAPGQAAAGWGLRDIGRAINRAAINVGHAVEKGTADAGHAINKAAIDGGHAVEKGAHDAGHAIEKGAHDTGHALEQGGQWVGKHPWETAIAVVAIAGGGYLIFYEGYQVVIAVEGVKVATITTGAASGIATGSALSLGGGVVATLPAWANPSSPKSSRSVGGDGREATMIVYRQGQPGADQPNGTLTSPIGPVRGSGLHSGSAANAAHRHASAPDEPKRSAEAASSADGAMRESVMFWPSLRDGANNWDKFRYAMQVARWAERVQPVEDFVASEHPGATQAEMKLLNALHQLDGIQDSEGHEAAVEHAEEMKHPILNFIGDLPKDYAKDRIADWAITRLLGETAAKLFGYYGNVHDVLSPVPIADDDMLMRDALRRALSNQLKGYLDRRVPNPPAPLLQVAPNMEAKAPGPDLRMP